MNMQLTKSQIGLDGVPPPKPCSSHVDGERGELIIAGDHVADLAGKIELRGRHRAALERRDRQAAQRGRSPRQPGRGPRTRLRRAWPTYCPRRAACRSSTAFARPSRGCAPRAGCDHEATIVGALAGDRRRAGAARQRQRPVAPDPTRRPRRRHAAHAARPQARPARSRSARRLFRHRVRSRHERLDLHHARGRLDAGRPVCGGHRRLLRADRTAAWRRAGAGAGNAGRDRHARAHQALDRRSACRAANA